MELWQAIKDDHRKVEAIFEKIQEGSGDREQLLRQLESELEAHTAGEEKAVYPELRQIAGLEDLVEHSLEEHDEVRQMLQRLGETSGEEQDELIEELQSAVEDHVEEEEEQIIPVAQKEIAGDKAAAMQREFEAVKQSIWTG
jgi:hemerythrin superfamily protein